MTQTLRVRRLATALATGLVVGCVASILAKLPVLFWGEGRHPAHFLLGAVLASVVFSINGLVAWRIQWWTFWTALTYAAGFALAFVVFESRETSLALRAQEYAGWLCVMMASWPFGRFIYWASRPHD